MEKTVKNIVDEYLAKDIEIEIINTRINVNGFKELITYLVQEKYDISINVFCKFYFDVENYENRKGVRSVTISPKYTKTYNYPIITKPIAETTIRKTSIDSIQIFGRVSKINIKSEIAIKRNPKSIFDSFKSLFRITFTPPNQPGFKIDMSIASYLNQSDLLIGGTTSKTLAKKLKTFISALEGLTDNNYAMFSVDKKKEYDPKLLLADITNIIDNSTKLYASGQLLSYEVEMEITDKKIDYSLLSAIYNKIFILNRFSFDDIKYELANKFANGNWRTLINNPVDLDKNTMRDLVRYNKETDKNKGYLISYKKDGLGSRIYIDSNNFIYLIIGRTVTVYYSETKECTNLSGTIIDGEYIEKSKVLILFDVCVYKNKLHTYTRLLPRLQSLKTILENDGLIKLFKSLKTDMEIEPSAFYGVTETKSRKKNQIKSLGDIAKQMYDKYNSEKRTFKYEIDGLIYTPIDAGYGNDSPPLKWKPLDKLTIDFLVVHSSRTRSVYVYDLYVVTTDEMSTNTKVYKEFGDTKFVRFGKKKQMYQYTTNRKNQLKNMTINEFRRYRNKWVFLRDRSADKKLPNFITVAQKILTLSEDPITKDDIFKLLDIYHYQGTVTGKNLRVLKAFHNNTKYKIFEKYVVKKTSLLDIGTGVANDMNKWVDASLTYICGVEPSSSNVEIAKSRVSKMLNSSRKITTYMKFDILNYKFEKFIKSKEYKQFIADKKLFDYATIFFAIHYFLPNKTAYKNVFKSLSKLMAKGGRLLIIALDGSKIMDKFRSIKEDTFGLIATNSIRTQKDDEYIISKSDKFKDKIIIGNKIKVFVGSIGTTNDEYLVDIDYLIKSAESTGFKLIIKQPFEEYYKGYCALNRNNKKFQRIIDELKEISFFNVFICLEKQ